MIYFIQEVANVNGLIKIGRCSNSQLRTRLKMLQIGSPAVLQVVKILLNSENERLFHLRFGMYHHHGEWFNPDESLKKFIKSIPSSEFDGYRIYQEKDLNLPFITFNRAKRSKKQRARKMSSFGLSNARFLYEFTCLGCKQIKKTNFPDKKFCNNSCRIKYKKILKRFPGRERLRLVNGKIGPSRDSPP